MAGLCLKVFEDLTGLGFRERGKILAVLDLRLTKNLGWSRLGTGRIHRYIIRGFPGVIVSPATLYTPAKERGRRGLKREERRHSLHSRQRVTGSSGGEQSNLLLSFNHQGI